MMMTSPARSPSTGTAPECCPALQKVHASGPRHPSALSVASLPLRVTATPGVFVSGTLLVQNARYRILAPALHFVGQSIVTG